MDGTAIAYRTVGAGPGPIVLGGVLRAGEDYLALAEALAPPFSVHLIDRRGRGGSGPLGDNCCFGRERDDLLAVQAATGARLLFGHSYGGFVALETARSCIAFIAVHAQHPERFFSVRARVLLLGGGRSPRFGTVELFDRLSGAFPGCISEILPGLDHFAPDEKAPHVVARRLTGFFQAAEATLRIR